MKCVCLPTDHPQVRAAFPLILAIAGEAFGDLEPCHLTERISRYQRICLAFDESSLVGFLFVTEHTERTFTLVGIRFAAVKPEYRRCGVTRKLTHAYFVYWLPRFIVKKMLKPTHKYYIFSRVCSPQAYASFCIGQKVEPDFITGKSWFPCNISRQIRGVMREKMGFEHLDVGTSQIFQGASSSGLFPKNSSFSTAHWAQPWEDYVGLGNEVVVYCKVGLSLFWMLARKVATFGKSSL